MAGGHQLLRLPQNYIYLIYHRCQHPFHLQTVLAEACCACWFAEESVGGCQFVCTCQQLHQHSSLFLSMSPLSDFSVNQIDRFPRPVAASRAVSASNRQSQLPIGAEKLVSKIMDAEPDEPYWDWIPRHRKEDEYADRIAKNQLRKGWENTRTRLEVGKPTNEYVRKPQ